MANKHPKGYKYGKGRLNGLAGGLLGVGLDGVDPEMDPSIEGSGGVSGLPEGALEGTGEGEVSRATALGYTPASSINSIQAPQYKKPGLWQNILSRGQAGQGYSRALQQVNQAGYQGRIQEALRQQAQQAKMEELGIGHDYSMEEAGFKSGLDRANAEEQRKFEARKLIDTQKNDLEKLDAAMLTKDGLPSSEMKLYRDVILPNVVQKAKFTGLEQGAQTAFAQSPEYAPLVAGDMRAKLLSQAGTNALNAANAEKAGNTVLGANDALIRPNGSSTLNIARDPLSDKPRDQYPRVVTSGNIDGTTVGIRPRTVSAQAPPTLVPPMLQNNATFNANGQGLARPAGIQAPVPGGTQEVPATAVQQSPGISFDTEEFLRNFPIDKIPLIQDLLRRKGMFSPNAR